MSFGKNIGFYRKQLKITQEELAERLYVSRQTISRWETDSVFPDVETIIKLCEIFGCDMDTLVRGDAEAKSNIAEESEQDAEENNGAEDEEEREYEKRRRRRWRIAVNINTAICSVSMIIAIFIYLLWGFLWGVWHPTWIVFIVAVTISAISSVITNIVF